MILKVPTLNLLLPLLFFVHSAQAQKELLDELNQEPDKIYTTATFKATKIVNMQTNEIMGAGDLQFNISHRFGAFNDDFLYNYFGLDNAQIRFSLDYSINDWLNLGVGRSSAIKNYDGFIKAKILRQATGKKPMPISLVWYSSINYYTLRSSEELETLDRLNYVNQVIIARKFSQRFSFQVAPTHVHLNRVESQENSNDLFSVGFGGRFKLTNRVALTGEYQLQLNPNTYDFGENTYQNALSIGVDIETGGHVFQLHLSNSQSMADPYWIAQNTGNWLDGDIYLGFNITRVFTLVKKK